MADNIFQKIIKKEIPANVLYEDELAIAFSDVNPVAPVHFLVIPKRDLANLAALTPGTDTLIGHCLYIVKKLMADQGISDYRVISNCGPGAGQTVPHLHFHALAGRDFTWPPG